MGQKTFDINDNEIIKQKTFDIEVSVGNDNGNSEHDIIINGDLFTQPNVYSRVSKLPNLDEVNIPYTINNLDKELITSINSPSLPVGTYYIGKKAFRSGAPISNIDVGIASNKFESDVPIVNTLAQIARYATEQAYKVNPDLTDHINVKVNMCTALPVSQYSKKSSEIFAEKFTRGTHEVTVHVGNLRAMISIEFEFVKIISEGVTAIFALAALAKEHDNIFNDFSSKYNFNVDEKYFMDKETKVFHIAIGEGTTEYPLTLGRTYDPDFAKGSNNGVGHAIDACLPDFIEENYLRANFSRQNFSDALKDESNKYHEIACDSISPYLDAEACSIFKYSKNRIALTGNDVDMVVCYGGGSIAMRDSLEKQLDNFCELTRIKLLYVPEEYAVSLEAKGLYEFTQLAAFAKMKAISKQ